MMIAMDDAQLADVHGQAWVIEFPHTEIRLDDLTERDFSHRPDQRQRAAGQTRRPVPRRALNPCAAGC